MQILSLHFLRAITLVAITLVAFAPTRSEADSSNAEYVLSVVAAEGVTIDGEPLEDGFLITPENIALLEFAPGARLVVKTSSGIKFNVYDSTGMRLVSEVVASGEGIALAGWTVGGGTLSKEAATLLALNGGPNSGLIIEQPGSESSPDPVVTPVSTSDAPTTVSGTPVPATTPASTPASPAATPSGP